MESCDVLVAGGGPAGSTLARSLRNSGLDVLLVDKSHFPRNKVCAGWITPQIIDALNLDLDDYARGNVLQPITGFSVGRMGGRQTTVHYGRQPVSYGIRRCEFDHYLLEGSGARISTGWPVKSIQRNGDAWIVNDRIRTPLIVGAGGHFCPLARYLGARPGRSEITVAAQEVEFRMTSDQLAACSINAEIPELYFCADLKGYGWIFRKGEYLNIGIGREDQHGLSGHVRQFCEYLDSRNRLPPGVLEKFNGHAYLLYQHASRRVLDDGILLVGDAAGLAYTQSGEGIRPAIESAMLAAGVIKEANGDFRAAVLERYGTLLERRFGKRPVRTVADYLPPGLKQVLAGKLLSTRFFIRNTVVDRWFLHRYQPPLACS